MPISFLHHWICVTTDVYNHRSGRGGRATHSHGRFRPTRPHLFNKGGGGERFAACTTACTHKNIVKFTIGVILAAFATRKCLCCAHPHPHCRLRRAGRVLFVFGRTGGFQLYHGIFRFVAQPHLSTIENTFENTFEKEFEKNDRGIRIDRIGHCIQTYKEQQQKHMFVLERVSLDRTSEYHQHV